MGDGAPRRGNLVFLALAQVFRLGSGLAINVLLMRALGLEGFGVYGYVMTLVGLLSFGASLGMERLINRELSRAPERGDALVSAGLVATAGLSLATGLAIVASAAALDGRAEVILAAALGAAALGLQSLATVPEAAIHASRRMRLSVRGHLVGRVALVAVTVAALLAGGGLASVFLAQVCDGLLTLLIIGRMYRRHLSQGLSWPPAEAVRGLARASVPFGLNLLFGSIYLSVDVIILAWLHDDAEVGTYRGAVMLVTLFPVIANTLTTGVYPKLSRHLGDPVAAGDELRFVSRVLLAVSLPAAVGGMMVAEPLMVFLGGDDYAVSALPFVIMAPLLPLRFLNNGFATALSALDRQEDRTRGVFIAAAVNLAANLAVIPAYGAAGAAATTLGTEVVLMAWMGWRIRPVVSGLGLLPSIARVAAPAALMAAALWALPPLHVLLTVAAGVAVYAAAGRVTGAWHPRDLSQLRKV